MQALAALLFVAVVAGLAACAEAPGGDSLFPLSEGRSWTYRVTTAADEDVLSGQETVVLANRGADRIDGAVSWRRRSDAGIEYWLRSDETGIYRIATRSPVEREPQTDRPRRYVLRMPYVVGTQWQADTTAYVLARRNEAPHEMRHVLKPFPMTYRIDALGQEVKTPAGSFSGCLRVAGTAPVHLYDDSSRTFRDVPLTTLEWYCPQVGLVRLERNEPSPTKFMVGGTVTMELTSWQ